MTRYKLISDELMKQPRSWLITGVAGFIGSNLLETLLRLNQSVTGLDNLSTGKAENLEEVRGNVTNSQWSRFTFIEGDICNLKTCKSVCEGRDYILHHAALCSVEQSIHDPIYTSTNNINGFLNILISARDTGAKRVVFASSSAIYGNYDKMPLSENVAGDLLSPYAADKYINEIHACLFSRIYHLDVIGLRYFNIFGPRQNIDTVYGSVIPRWFYGMIRGENVFIYGDGKTSRDFCYIENCVQANILAASVEVDEAVNKIYNVGLGTSTDLNHLYDLIKEHLSKKNSKIKNKKPIYKNFRPGDIRHSLSDITNTQSLLGYQPQYSIEDGLAKAARWYLQKVG